MNSDVLKPAIVLSSYTMGLGVIRALGRMGVPIVAVYYDKKDMGYVSKYVKEKIQSPHPERAESDFVDLLVKLADRYKGSFLVPSSDATLATVSQHKALLEQYYTVGCTEWPITEQYIDKKCTYALADSVGVPAPKTVVPHSTGDVEQYAQTIEFPCLVKPTHSHRYYAKFKTKMIKVNTLDEMMRAYSDAAAAGLDVMLQEIIPGGDSNGVNYNSYFWNGEPVAEFTAPKIRNAPPTFGSPRVAISGHVPEAIEYGRKILKAMNFYGFACTEFKRDSRDGVYKLMEVNGRHNLSSLLAVRCGMNFPWIHYNHLMNGALPPHLDYEKDVYWIDIIRDLGYSLKARRQEGYSFKQYITPYLHKHVFAIYDWNDPKPFMKRCFDIAKSLGKAL